MRRIIPSIVIALCLWLLPGNGISGDQDKYLPQWLNLLKTGNAKEKQLALRSLWFLQYEEYRKDPNICAPIFAALKDKDPIVREAAAAFWTRMEGPLGVSMFKVNIPSYLIPVLQDEVPAVRAEAAKAANGIKIYANQQLVDALIKSLHDKDPWVRLNVVYALGELGYKGWSVTTTRKPEQRLEGPPLRLKTNGAKKVRKMEPGGEIATLPDVDPSGHIRRMASTREMAPHPIVDDYKKETTRQLLDRSPNLNVSGAIGPMIEILEKEDDWRQIFVQQEVVYAFSKMHVQDENAIAAMLRKYENAHLKMPIIKAFGLLEALSAEQVLLKSLEDNDEGTRKVALEALLQLPIKWAERERKNIIQDGKDKLSNPYPEVRMYTVRVLARSRYKEGENLIIAALRDKNDEVVRTAIEELGYSDNEGYLKDVLPFFSSENKTVRDTSVKAFHQIAERTTKERAYYERRGTKRVITKINDNLPRTNSHQLQRTASGLLVSELSKGNMQGKISALSIVDDYEDERIEPQLIRLLDDESPEVRSRSAFLLREYGTGQSVPGLVKVLKTTDRKLKLNAIFALGVVGDERAKKPLMELRKDNDENVRSAALEALEKYCDPDYLNDSNPRLRAAALRCLEQRGNTDVYKIALAELVSRKSQPQMIAAMDVISKTKDPRAVEPLIIILKEGDIHVAGKAASLLGMIGDRRAVEPLSGKLIYLDKLGRDYTDNGMKYEIIKALKKIGDPRAVPVLVQMLKSDSAGVIDASISALGELKDSRAVPGLISVSDTFRYLQSSVRALGEIGSPSALDHLERLLYKYDRKEDKIGYIRSDIIQAIGKINDEKQDALIIRYLASSSFMANDLFAIVDMLIKRNNKTPATVMSMAIAVGRAPRELFESVSWKISDFAKDPKSHGDITSVLIAAFHGDNKDAKVGGIRIYGYYHRYNIVRDERALDSLKQLASDSDPRVQSEAKTELKLIEMSQSKKGKS